MSVGNESAGSTIAGSPFSPLILRLTFLFLIVNNGGCCERHIGYGGGAVSGEGRWFITPVYNTVPGDIQVSKWDLFS